MRLIIMYTTVAGSLMLTGCAHKGTNPVDPYETFNRKVHGFNMAVDKAVLKPAATIYTTILPAFVRKGIDNAFNNIDMIPSVANDLLQAEGKWAIKDTWRFVLNSTIGFGGLYDAAEKCGLPPHYNDLGLTLAKWGDKKSPYLVLPLIGPSTIRDGSGMLFQFALWNPYIYINNDAWAYGLAGLRYIDLRAQLLDSEQLMNEALDKYSFIRDAYLQHRNYLITGAEQDNGSNYIDDGKAELEKPDGVVVKKAVTAPNVGAPSDYVDE
jgi:phospholipid-binding lipoprotein MlaA